MITATHLETLERDLEAMLREFCQGPDSDSPNLPDEIIALARGQLGLTAREINSERLRVLSILHNEADVLPDSEVARVQDHLSRSKQALETESPKILEQIEKLQQRLVQLQQAPVAFERQLEADSTARANLETLMPRWALRRLKRLADDNRDLIATISELRSAVDHAKVVLANTDNVDIVKLYEFGPTRQIIEGVQVSDQQPLLDVLDHKQSGRTYVISEKCQKHFALMQKRLPELESDLVRLQAELDEAVSATEKDLRSMYYRG